MGYVWFTSVRTMARCRTLTLEDSGGVMEGRFPCGACCLGNAVSSNSDSNDPPGHTRGVFCLSSLSHLVKVRLEEENRMLKCFGCIKHNR